MMLFLPLPLLIKAQLPLRRYAALRSCFTFSLTSCLQKINPFRYLRCKRSKPRVTNLCVLTLPLHRFLLQFWTAVMTSPLATAASPNLNGRPMKHPPQSSSPTSPTYGHSSAASSVWAPSKVAMVLSHPAA